MTGFADNIYSGLQAVTSGAASYAPAIYNRTFRFTGGGAQTQQFVLPQDAQNLWARVYIIADGSAATSDTITVSAGGSTLLTIASFGSVQGVFDNTIAGLGTITYIASACANFSTSAEVSAALTLASTDVATDYQVQLSFSRLRRDPLGNT